MPDTRNSPKREQPRGPDHEQITQKLREYYDSVQDEGIPDRFLDLLERLDEAERKSSGADKA
ncbi:NepR family anti-sigma factor [Stappia sp.]|jgi:hypothetical protein|uniref:NepR family anti-sigma factor n=1 Tax=Stappia sp. TaxID=1870903 RepID=UPI003A99610B